MDALACALRFDRAMNPVERCGIRALLLRHRVARMDEHEPGVLEIRDVGTGGRGNVHTVEYSPVPLLASQAPGDLVPDGLLVLPEAFGIVVGRLSDRGLGVEPVVAMLLVEVRRSLRELFDRAPEVPQRITGHGGAEPQVLFVEPLPGALASGGRAHENRAGEALGDEPLAQARPGAVDLTGGRARPVDVGIDDRLPLIRQVLRQVGVDRCRIQGNVAWQDQRRHVVGGPQFVHDRRDELEHAACALEPLQSGPVLVQPVQKLRVERVAGADPLLVLRPRHRGVPREYRCVVPIHGHEVAGHGRDHRPPLRVRLLEEPAANDFERLVLARRLPLVGDAANHVLKALEGQPPVRSPDLDLVSTPGVGGGDRHHQHGPGHGPHDLRQRLRERELRVE